MHDDFTFRSVWLEQAIPRDRLVDALSAQREIPGTITPLGPRGVRFIPDLPAYPPTYFGPDGQVIELVVKDLDSFDVDTYLTGLAQLLRTKILTDTLEYC